MLMRATPDSPRMFERDWIDGFSRTPWWTIPLVWLPIVGWLFSLSFDALSPLTFLGGFFGGWLIWTLTEYLLHRHLFHWSPPFRWGPRLQFILHGVHHEWVQDRYRLVMPPVMGLIIAVPFVLGFRALFGPTWFGVLMAGFFFGYVVYDLSHYAIHHLKWKNPVFQAIKKHHLLHHFGPSHTDRKYGVSNTLWDHILRTY
jgi:sterol desaturase/sphingolipid hydroxylase (fatty acid hydroxylase superfamily)